MASIWKKAISLSIFGESHGKGIGAVIDNLPCGYEIDMDKTLEFMARRAPSSKKAGSTARNEKDTPEILSGILNDKTTGAPLSAVIYNKDQRSFDYDNIETLARPGHADYTGHIRYSGFNDIRGGGHFSGRLTAPIVFAGAVCGQILENNGIYTFTHISSINGVKDIPFNSVNPDADGLLMLRKKGFPVNDDSLGEKMKEEIKNASSQSDSVGGTIECLVTGVPAGVGSPMFDGIENDIASIIFGIPAVKGLEFGAGFESANMMGSENNDEFYCENGTVKTKTNHHGGILGGISSGMPIVFNVCFKPTPSISKEQKTVNYKNNKNETLSIHGRHDACIVPRAVPVVEAATNIAILSQMIEHGKIK